MYITSRKAFDRDVQRAKRFHWFSLQDDILEKCNVDNNSFWKSIGKIGVGNTKSKRIPMEVVLDNGQTSTTVEDVLDKWKRDCSSLFNNANHNNSDHSTSFTDTVPSEALAFNHSITILEVNKAVDNANRGKAHGADNIPAEVLKNDTTVLFLHALFKCLF